MPTLRNKLNSSAKILLAHKYNANRNHKRKRNTSDDVFFGVFESRKIRNISSSHLRQLHDEKRKRTSEGHLKAGEENVSPQAFLLSELRSCNIDVTIRPSLETNDFFLQPTQDQMDAYNHVVVQAIRSKDLNKLQELNDEGHSLQICNRFGESLIHMACRRGFTEVVRFLIYDSGVSVCVRDDFGRTPLHDACWTSEPNFELMDLLLEEEPKLLFMSDKRGNVPLEYVRREHWGAWISYLRRQTKNIRWHLR